MKEHELVGIWEVKEIFHLFLPAQSRIPARDFKDEKTQKAFCDFRFVFTEDREYRIYSDSDLNELRHRGKWYSEDGEFYYDPFVSEGFNREQLKEMSLLTLINGELTVNLCFFKLYLSKIE